MPKYRVYLPTPVPELIEAPNNNEAQKKLQDWKAEIFIVKIKEAKV